MKMGITKKGVNLTIDQFRNISSCIGVLSSIAYDDKLAKGRGQLRFSELDVVNDIVIEIFTNNSKLLDTPFKEYPQETLDKVIDFFVNEWNRRVTHIWLLQDQQRITKQNQEHGENMDNK